MTSTPTHRVDFLLIGGGVAAVTAAQTLRAESEGGSIALLSAETELPYHRPPLSKASSLRDPARLEIPIRPASFYEEQRIDLRLGQLVVAVDPSRHVVRTSDGGHIGYGKLLIATGAEPRTLAVPGADLPGVFTLRTKADARAIREAAAKAKSAVVLGGSFLGMEIAFALRDLGLAVTIVERGPVLLHRLMQPALSDRFRRLAESRGIRVLLNDNAETMTGRGRVRAVRCVSGENVPADLVVVSIGVLPATSFLAGSGIALQDGYIVVDEQMRASAPDVFAAGDVTLFYDPIFARQRHIEHWDNAVKQGRLAARNMLGRRLRFDEVSYFFCEIGSPGFSVLGATSEGSDWVTRGDPESTTFSMFYLRDDVPRAFFAMGREPDEIRWAEGLIRHRVNLARVKGELSNPSFRLDQLPRQTALILQGGGALGAYEWGVVRALEKAGVTPDIVAGVSIGAFNGAIVASHPGRASEALAAFWNDLSVAIAGLPGAAMRGAAAAAQILTLGVPGFFQPRWLTSGLGVFENPANWTSLYDTSPMRELIARYVDFPALKRSPVRLLVSAVDVATAKLAIFDSYVDDLTPDHVLASGSLPPGFPWTEIDGKAYWDGGIVSNSPLDLVNERCGHDGKRVFVVDLFSNARPLPRNMVEVLLRRDEIVYAERVRNDLRQRETEASYRALVSFVLSHVAEEDAARIRNLPPFIQLMGRGADTEITRFVREARRDEPPSRDYDFSAGAIRDHMEEGYRVASRVLGLRKS
ncbi:FAD-dependent oxidoreductase [Alsobacter sp. SYSU M60028]|uniref:FAD-dependent oxidoreductase n=1 Tax=Alsobacter ponti TaxID=2962936 RepID=A0ABT1L7X1_9HYPH|nr:FAD-dependent oxidoreductase [Alsobacter ponti]MCP8937589.1 FAD-dependent oxidoreductase [Alsobacter ponti]